MSPIKSQDMSDEPALIAGNSIVLLGSFDPSKAQPRQLIEKGLFRTEDAAGMTINVALPDAMGLTVDWMSLGVQTDRMIASTVVTRPLPEPVRDFVLDLIEEMPHARLDALGINTDYHFGTANMETWHSVGHALAPKEDLWAKCLKSPGLLSMTIQSERDDGLDGYVRVKVEPSLQIPNGVYIQVNDHFTRATGSKDSELAETLEHQWTNSLARADRIIRDIKTLVSGLTRG